MDELIYLMFPGDKWASLASLLDDVTLTHYVVDFTITIQHTDVIAVGTRERGIRQP